MKYRPEIDGLRAVAVLPVILFHAGFQFLSGGFLGVDIFFVLSGFLITTIIMQEHAEGKFSLKNFYKRRARRILPALFLVILATLPFAWFWLLPTQLKDYSQSVLGAVFFFSNIHFWKKSGYFAEASEEKPLLHTWSLAVEEQYYIFFPLLIMFLWRKNKNIIPHVIAIIGLLSLAASEYASRYYEDANFYLLHTRAWELFAGSLAAIFMIRRDVKPSNALSLIGLALIITSLFIYDASTPWPSTYTALPIIGTVLILIFAAPSTIAYKILSLRPLVGIGLISYSAYLWHQPLFAFARVKSLEEPSQALMLGLATAAIFLAFLSWKFIETPFRKQQFKLFSPAKGLAVVMMILIVSYLVGNISKGAVWRYDGEIAKILKSKKDYTPPRESCNYPNDTDDCWLNDSENKAVLLLGDSHANGISNEINKSLEKLDINIKKMTERGCLPAPNMAKIGVGKSHKCYIYGEYIDDKIFAHPEYKTIVLHGRWTIRFEGPNYKTFNDGKNSDFDLVEHNGGEGRKDRLIKESTDFIQKLLDADKNVVLVYNVAENDHNTPENAARIFSQTGERTEISMPYDVIQKRHQYTFDAFDAIHHPNLYHFKPTDFLCSKEQNKCLDATKDGIYYKDNNHLTNAGVRLFADNLAALIKSVSDK